MQVNISLAEHPPSQILQSASLEAYKYYVQIIVLLIFRKTINAGTVMFAVVQLIRGAIIAVSKQYSHFLYYDF